MGVPTRHKWVKCSYYIAHFMFNDNSYIINAVRRKKDSYDSELSRFLSRDIPWESHRVSAFLSWHSAFGRKDRISISMMRLMRVSC